MDKEDLLKLKELIENELEKVEKTEENKKGVRQKPKLGEEYYYLTDEGRINKAIWNSLYRDNLRFEIGNCFKTEQEALSCRENLVTKQQLKDLALELNNGVEIDWNKDDQYKHQIYFSFYTSKLSQCWAVQTQDININCLNPDFLEIAKKRIGEEKLIKLIKSGV